MKSIEPFILGTVGVPSFLCKKTLYSHPKAGLGMQHLENRVLTRILDNLHKASAFWHVFDRPHPKKWCEYLLDKAASMLGACTPRHHQPAQTQLTFPSPELGHLSQVDAPPLGVRYASTTHGVTLLPHQVFTDGSHDPPSGQMGSAVLLPNGAAAILKPPWKGSSYVAELYALALGTLLCPPHAHIFSDSQGALAAVRGNSQRVFHSTLVDLCRRNIRNKH